MNTPMQFTDTAENMHAEAAEDAEREASMRDALRSYVPRRNRIQEQECEHGEYECGHCIECGKDCSDDLVAAAEYARDCAQDR